MLRRLLLPILLLLPASLAAQSFTPFSAPGGELWFHPTLYGTGGAALHQGEELYLLDATGARVKLVNAVNTGTNYLDTFLGTFAPGEQFGFEWTSLTSGLSDRSPTVLGGDLTQFGGLHLESDVFVTFSDARIGYDVYDASIPNPNPIVTPEPVSVMLLGTGLVGLGAVALRRRRRRNT